MRTLVLLTLLAVPTAAGAQAAGQVRGSVFYGRHQPAVGAVVLVRPEGAATPVFAATTGVSGSFAFDGVPNGTYVAEVRRDGFIPVLKSGIVVRMPFRAVVEVLLVRGSGPAPAAPAGSGEASLTGHVRGAQGAPLVEGRVKLTKAEGGDDPRIATTDATGAFAFPGLSGGRWRLEVQGAGLLPLRTSLDLSGDVTVEAALGTQPPDYMPPPQDLIVPEEAIPPPA
ncbi:MAG TPA: carboxypeptidase-like regulatory domain-containing protein [Candidatus Polarisedimenticolaceae bacterium]|nr:carboxypeptidase-like regulatory domain-containing protein [Candidatus Polarisedimenticolaceae bacterium]